MTFAGHVSPLHAWVTVTVKVHEGMVPRPMICSWQVTVVVPTGKVLPDAGEQMTAPHAADGIGGG